MIKIKNKSLKSHWGTIQKVRGATPAKQKVTRSKKLKLKALKNTESEV